MNAQKFLIAIALAFFAFVGMASKWQEQSTNLEPTRTPNSVQVRATDRIPRRSTDPDPGPAANEIETSSAKSGPLVTQVGEPQADAVPDDPRNNLDAGVIPSPSMLFGSQSIASRSSEESKSSFAGHDADYVVAIVLDTTPSFAHEMAKDGDAFRQAVLVVDQACRQLAGSKVRLVVSQISGYGSDSVLFEGTARDLRHRFASPEEFHQFVDQRKVDDGSAVITGLTKTINYALDHEAIRKGDTRLVVCVFSDLSENVAKTHQEYRDLASCLNRFGNHGGTLGLYMVDEDNAEWWKETLALSTITDYRVESSVVASPSLPNLRRR